MRTREGATRSVGLQGSRTEMGETGRSPASHSVWEGRTLSFGLATPHDSASSRRSSNPTRWRGSYLDEVGSACFGWRSRSSCSCTRRLIGSPCHPDREHSTFRHRLQKYSLSSVAVASGCFSFRSPRQVSVMSLIPSRTGQYEYSSFPPIETTPWRVSFRTWVYRTPTWGSFFYRES